MRLVKSPELSVVMPVYKQAKKIERYLKKLDAILKKTKKTYEIICVIDGEVDGSYQAAKKTKLLKLKVFSYKQNQGKGNAVRFGMSKAKGAIVGFVDGGFDLKYSCIPLALEHMKWYDADVVIGSKRHPASKVTYPWQRRILSWGYQMGVRILFGINVRDSQVGIKFFKRKVIKKIMPKLLIKAFAFDIEMLAVANRMGFRKIYEFPVEIDMEFAGGSMATANFFKTSWSMLWDTLAVFYRLKIRQYYDA